jgi:hypothetical protein
VPALVGPIVGFTLGVLLSWLCRGEAPREDDAAGRARARVAALFAALVFAPACAYFVIFAGDWALFYLTDSRGVPSALLLVLVVLDAAAVVAGFWAGYQAARRQEGRTLLGLGLGPGAAAAAISLSFLSQLRVDGTFHQVSARFGTRPVAGGPLGYAILWMGAMLVAGLVIAGRALVDKPRPAPAPQRAPAPVEEAGEPVATEEPREEGQAPQIQPSAAVRQPLLGRKRKR